MINIKKVISALVFAFSFFIFSAGTTSASDKKQVYSLIKINAAITPPIAEFILQSIDESSKEGADGLIIFLDTPGGLDLAMRDIVKGILNSAIPVLVYVHPAGARAASAGVVITMAAHIAAMTPGTNMGAAHPVGLGGGSTDKVMMEKVENDAVAYLRGIASKRGRNENWAEQAIRKSESIAAEEALKIKVIDFVAEDLNHLLEQVNNKEVIVASGKIVLKTKGAIINERKMGTRQQILSTITDPNIAYILLLLGLAGLYFEFSNPGVLVPGIVGAISLILAFFALQTLPVNFAGVLLILFAVVLFVAELKVVSKGALTIGGVISLVMGSLLLFDSPDPAFRVSLQVMLPVLTAVTLFFVTIIILALRAQLRRKRTGQEGMIGEQGITMTDVFETGKVFIKGEYWTAWSDSNIEKGKKVKVVKVLGLKIKVEEIKN